MKEYNENLAKRFVSDYKLPIQNFNALSFPYYLDLYEKDFRAKTKWKNLIRLIKERFDSNSELFLAEYYKKRDEIITSILNSSEYQEFNNMDMSVFAVKDKLNIPKTNIYNGANIGKRFLSIDMKKANFQALKYVGVIKDAETYEDFIHKYTDLDYIANSKYTRQVIFGKLNPKRHITVEKFLINKVAELYMNNFDFGTIVSMTNDEIVIELSDDAHINLINLTEKIKRYAKIDVRCEIFKLYGIQLSTNSGKKREMMYMKKISLPYMKTDYACIPVTYHAIVYKLLNDLGLNKIDFQFSYEGLQCSFDENFKLEIIR